MSGVAHIACRRIPCLCHECTTQLMLEWDHQKDITKQPRHAQNQACEKWPIFEGENDWEIAKITFQKDNPNDIKKDVHTLVLHDMTTVISMDVTVGNFGVMDVEAPHREFDLAEFTSLPCDHSK